MAKTIAGKILSAVFSLFRDNWPSFVARIFNKIPEDVKNNFTIGIMIVENIKTFLEGDVAKFITHVIPGDLDEELRQKTIEVLKKVLTLSNDVTVLGRFELVNNNRGVMVGLASELNSGITGLPYDQSVVTTQVVYTNLKADGKLD